MTDKLSLQLQSITFKADQGTWVYCTSKNVLESCTSCTSLDGQTDSA